MEQKNIGFNTRCEQLKQTLIDTINQSNLPIGVVFYIAKGIMADIESTYYGVLNSEAQEMVETVNGGGDK